MAKNKNLIWILALLVSFIFPTGSLNAASTPTPVLIDAGDAASIPTPVIVAVDQSVRETMPLVTGLVAPGTEVLIYINGIFEELAEINETKTLTDNFYYQVTETSLNVVFLYLQSSIEHPLFRIFLLHQMNHCGQHIRFY